MTDEERRDASEDEEGRRPPSVREALGPPRPASSRKRTKPEPVRDSAPPPGLRGQRERPEPARGDRKRRSRGADIIRPTPVREAMDAPPVPETRPSDLPSRPLDVEGEAWVVRVAGRTETGLPRDAGAPLLQLRFYREAEPETAVLEVLCVGRDLDGLTEGTLVELHGRARPVLDPEARAAGEDGTRRSG